MGVKGRGTAFAVPSPWLKFRLSPSARTPSNIMSCPFIHLNSFIHSTNIY